MISGLTFKSSIHFELNFCVWCNIGALFHFVYWHPEGLMPKQKLPYFGHLMWRVDSLEETLMMGKSEGRRRRGNKGRDGQVTWMWANSGRQWGTGKPGMLQSTDSQRHNLVTEQQQQQKYKISFPNIICWKNCPFLIVYSWQTCQRSANCICTNIFLNSVLFCRSICLP